jgi:hypothetical protein
MNIEQQQQQTHRKEQISQGKENEKKLRRQKVSKET